MKILFAAPETAFGGFLRLIRKELPRHEFLATGSFNVGSLKGVDILIPTMSPVTRAVLEEGDRLRLVQQCGAGLEGVDIKAAGDLGIAVANVPTDISGNADSVAELGIYLMIGLARDARAMARSLARKKMGEPMGMALSGRTVGLVGLGGIGRALIRRLRPFDVRLIGIRRTAPDAALRELGLEWAGGSGEMDLLLGRSDFVVLCLPHTPESHHLMGRRAFSLMKPSGFLINLSRGGLVDREALAEALAEHRIAGAGLDVFWDEPPDPDDPVFGFNVLATPHVAGSTDISMKGIVEVVRDNIHRVARGLPPRYAARTGK